MLLETGTSMSEVIVWIKEYLFLKSKHTILHASLEEKF